MSTFSEILDGLRKSRSELFDPLALQTDRESAGEPLVAVEHIEVPWNLEFARSRHDSFISPTEWEYEGMLSHLFSNIQTDGEIWPDLEPELDNTDQTSRRDSELEGYESGPSRVGIELLAIYLPFHFYPDNSWGVHFFEGPMRRFAARVYALLGSSLPKPACLSALKLATYSVARHEFSHFLTELLATDIELKGGRRQYRPYYDTVYKKTYAKQKCWEETVANVWAWDNPGVRSPAIRQQVFRNMIRAIPVPCYSAGANYDSGSVRPIEDRLAAQVNQISDSPPNPPPLWGILPRPYVQPWTRYENVEFTMSRSAGGVLAKMLNSNGGVKKTIKIYHR